MAYSHNLGVKSVNQDWFLFNQYTGQWERVLVRQGEEQGYMKQVSMPITPVEGQSWKDLWEKKLIKCYHYIPHKDDLWVHVLPQQVWIEINKGLTTQQAEFMVDHPVMGYLDIRALFSKPGPHYYDEIAVNRYKNGHWIKLYKTFPQLFKYRDVAPKASEESLNKLVKKFKD